jgi:hypothetical protein
MAAILPVRLSSATVGMVEYLPVIRNERGVTA